MLYLLRKITFSINSLLMIIIINSSVKQVKVRPGKVKNKISEIQGSLITLQGYIRFAD
jgi:hypothetical protein